LIIKSRYFCLLFFAEGVLFWRRQRDLAGCTLTQSRKDSPATSIGIGFHYLDPVTEVLTWGEPQIWKITHNGVDTHAIHIHLVNLQLINLVGWDCMIKPPDPEEWGWKGTIKMNPLEDICVAVKPVRVKLIFGVPNSYGPLDPSMPLGTTMQLGV
jgi:hypothetical protein